MSVIRSVSMLAMVLWIASSASAQPWRNLPPLERHDIKSLEEAKRLAEESHRVLIVYPRGSKVAAHRRTIAALNVLGFTPGSSIVATITDGFTLMEERTWAHPELHSFIQEHAIFYTVEQGGEENTEFQELKRMTQRPLDEYPHVLVYIGNTQRAMLPQGHPDGFSAAMIRGRNFQNSTGSNGELDPSRFFPKPEQVLFEAMSAMELQATRDPVWGMLHKQNNPLPVVHIKTFYSTTDRQAPAFSEPAEASQEQVLAIWHDARVAAASGDSAYAIGAYTWLWERASDLAPESVGVRSWLLASEMADLARRDAHALARFTAMHDAMGVWWASLSSEQWVDYFTLGEVVGREAWSLDYLVGNTVGWFASDKTTPGDLPMLSAAQRVKFDLLSSRDRWTDGTDGTDTSSDPSSVIDRIEGFNRQLNTLSPQNASPEEIDDAIGIYRRVLRHEVTLAYITAMGRGDTNAVDAIRHWYTTHERLGAEFAQQLLEFAEASSLDAVSPSLER